MTARESTGSPLDRDFVALLLQRSEYVQSAAEKVAPTDFEDEALSDIYSLILLLHEDEQPLSPSQLIDKVAETTKKELIAALAAKDFQNTDLNQVYTDLVIAFHRRHRTKRMTELKRLLKEAELENDEDRINFYMNEIKLLRQEL